MTLTIASSIYTTACGATTTITGAVVDATTASIVGATTAIIICATTAGAVAC